MFEFFSMEFYIGMFEFFTIIESYVGKFEFWNVLICEF